MTGQALSGSLKEVAKTSQKNENHFEKLPLADSLLKTQSAISNGMTINWPWTIHVRFTRGPSAPSGGLISLTYPGTINMRTNPQIDMSA